ncbi:hypothetical protein SAY86_016395 [Trapa natans]|uniref:DYW domain-containing protein n=1 Tax=Trapa natans TaxID=22666 RepID=A0AAN7L6T0_TRANT|nr:hypothetical protein SAY86_016395 [Trapa natans]
MAALFPAAASQSTPYLSRDPIPHPFFNPVSSNHGWSSQSSRCSAMELHLKRLTRTVQAFDGMPVKYGLSSSSSVSSSTGFDRALVSFEKMMAEGLMPSGFFLLSLLEGIMTTGDVQLGKQLHSFAIRGGFVVDVGARVSLINMYSSLGMLDDSRRVFDEISMISLNDGQLWNSMISAYLSHDHFPRAFLLYQDMLSLGFDRSMASTHVKVLKACGSTEDDRYGKMIHGRIIKDEALVKETCIQNCLVTFYAKCRRLDYAYRLFEGIYGKDVVSWNAIISANEQNSREDEAVHLFYRMIRDDPFVHPNRITFLSILSSFSRLGALRLGKEINGHIIRSGIAADVSIVNALITMYSRCKQIRKAEVIFEKALCKDIVTWNSMLAAYEQNDMQEKCLDLFNRMQISGLQPDGHSFTIACSAALSESGNRRLSILRAREFHGHALRRCSMEVMENIPVSNAILKMYSKCDCIDYASRVFASTRSRDSYSWNAIMDAYCRNNKCKDAFIVYIEMLELDLSIDHITYSTLLTSCGSSADLLLGKQLHSITLKTVLGQETGSVDENSILSIANCLISMYAKCGSIGDACRVFARMDKKDVISWTAMITGYAEHGLVLESLKLFKKMKKTGVQPNEVTFLGLIMACSHGGLVEKGEHYFHSMTKDYGIRPSAEHYAIMLDLFGRAGWLNRAREFLASAISNNSLISSDELKLWKVLLGSCILRKELDLGIESAGRVLMLAPDDESAHVQLSNLYAMSGFWEDAIKVRKIMQEKGLKKEVGCSWIDVNNKRHVFVAGDAYHVERRQIYKKLEELDMKVRDLGYRPTTDFVVHDMEEIEKEMVLRSHSERLAVAFGLLKRKYGPIRVIKNLRVCRDCHDWMKFTSQVEKVEILLRDARRFHCFHDRKCSCGDFW